MKKVSLISSLFLLFFFTSFLLKAQSENAISGIWYNTEKTAKVEILKKGSAFIGKIVWLKDPNPGGKPAVDKDNLDAKLKSRPLMGLNLLEGLKFDSGMWEDGTIYDPKTGKTYSCQVTLKSKDVLEVKGYIGFSLIGRTVEWTKEKP
jgi:uncharacterized protein (DUF2147 family)